MALYCNTPKGKPRSGVRSKSGLLVLRLGGYRASTVTIPLGTSGCKLIWGYRMSEKNEDNVYKFYPFKVPRLASNQFFESSQADNTAFMTEDLAKSGLVKDDLY